MANNNEDIKITIVADTSDVVDGFKDVEKGSDKMAKNVVKDSKEMGKSFDDVAKSTKSIQSAFKNIDMKSLSTALKNIGTQAKNIASTVKKQLTSAFNVKGNVQVNTSTTTDASGGASGGSSMGAMGSIMTGGAIGAGIAKSLAITKDLFKYLGKAGTQMKQLAKPTKIGIAGEVFTVETLRGGIEDLQHQLEQSGHSGVTFKDAMENVEGSLKYVQDILDKTVVSVDEFAQASAMARVVLNQLTGGNGLIRVDEMDSIRKLGSILEECQRTAQQLNAEGISVVKPETLTGLKYMTKELSNSISGVNKFKIICLESFLTVREKASELGQKLANAIPDGVLKGKATNIAHALKSVGQKIKELNTNAQGGSRIKEFFNSFKNNSKQLLTARNLLDSFIKKVKQTAKETNKATKSMSGGFKGLMKSVGSLLGIYQGFNLIKTSVTGAMDSIETTNMFMSVFGKNAQTMSDKIKELNQSMGLGLSNTKQFTAIVGQMGSAMGLSSEDAMNLSLSMAKMAGDISSFYNTDIVQVQEDLRSALSGSFETMDKYGIVLRENTIKQFAYNEGIARTGAELTNAQRAMATTAYIAKSLGQANGDMAKTMDTPAGRARRLAVAFSELKVALGNVVLPIWNAVMPSLIALANALTSVFNTIASVVNGILSLFGKGLKTGGGGGIVEDAQSIGTSLSDGLDSASGGASDVADDLAKGAKSAKEIAKGLMGIDEINALSSPDSGSSGGGSGSSGGAGAGGGLGGALGDAYEVTQQGESIFDSMTEAGQAFVDGFKEVWSKFKLGFMTFKDDILAQWNLLKENIKLLGSEIVTFFTSCWKMGGSDIAIHLGALTATITATFLSISNIVVEAVTNLFKHLNPESNQNVAKFISAFDEMIVTIRDFVSEVDGHFQTFMNKGGQAFLNNLGDIAFIMGTILAQAITDCTQAFSDFANSDLGQAIIESLAESLETVSGWIENILTFIRDNQGVFEAFGAGILVAYGAFKVFSSVTGWITNLVGGVVAFINSFGGIGAIVSSVVGFITSPIGIAIAIIGALVAVGVLLYKNWDTIKAKAKEIWDKVVKWFNDAGVDIEGILKDMWSNVKKRFNDMKDVITTTVKAWWDFIKTAFNAIFNVVKTIVTSVWNIIKSTFNVILTTIQWVLSAIVGVFTGDWSKCKDITLKLLNSIVDWMKSILTGGIKIIGSILGGVGDIFKSAWNGAVNITTTIFQKIVDKIKEKLNKARDFVKGIVDKIKGFFNFSFTIPKIKLPHFSIKPSGWSMSDLLKGTIPTLGISWYADGGVLRAGSNAIFGMNGNTLMAGGELSTGGEAILPLNTLFKEMNNMFDKQTQRLASMNNGGGDINITLEMDGKQVAKGVYKQQKQMTQLGQLDWNWL